MKNLHFKSRLHFRFENGKMTGSADVKRDILINKDSTNDNIYHISIKNPNEGSLIMAPKAMKIIGNEMGKLTLEGIKLNDGDNKWGNDFSDYGIQLTQDISGEIGTISLSLKDRNVLITYQ